MPAATISVLVVDDDPSVGAWLQLLVRRMGDTLPCTSSWVTSGAVALEELQRKPYDLVFLDYHLQDMDGLTVLSVIQQKPKAEQPAVIILTGGGNEKIAVEAMKKGARDYLIKGSLDQATLRRTMSAALDTRRLEAELQRSNEEIRAKNTQMEAELAMAREVQQALLPQQYPIIPRGADPDTQALRFAHHWQPSSAMAGDFFEIIPVSDTAVGLFLCDVMGHGVRAALVTALLRGLLAQAGPNSATPSLFLRDLNRELKDILQRSNAMLFATAVYLVADVANNRIQIANAGHPHPLLVRQATGDVSLWQGPEGPDPALGLIPDTEYSTHTIPMGAGDSLIVYTDGIYEPETAEGEAFGTERLIAGVKSRLGQPTPMIFDGLMGDLRAFLNVDEKAVHADDICLVSVKFP